MCSWGAPKQKGGVFEATPSHTKPKLVSISILGPTAAMLFGSYGAENHQGNFGSAWGFQDYTGDAQEAM